MYKALHPRNDVDRLYVLRKEEGGLTSIEDSVHAPIQRHKDYIEKREERLITATRKILTTRGLNKNRKKNNSVDVLSN